MNIEIFILFIFNKKKNNQYLKVNFTQFLYDIRKFKSSHHNKNALRFF